MKLLILHNRYRESGGEDGVVSREADLLRQAGHEVEILQKDNQNIQSGLRIASTALGTPWNFSSVRELAQALEEKRPDLVHIHNLFPQWSPGCIHLLQRLGIPSVMTVHNYRLLCPSATLYHEQAIYEKSLGKRFPFNAIRDKVYRGSAMGTAVQVFSNGLHQALGTYTHRLGGMVFLSAFQKELFLKHLPGLKEERCFLKPNFLPDPGAPTGTKAPTQWVFIGRLTEEKGIPFLMDLFRDNPSSSLKIFGTGPLEADVLRAASESSHITYHGQVDAARIQQALSEAKGLLFPSTWYEGFPLTLVEAMAHGVPVLASNLGSMTTILEDQRHGRLLPVGDLSAWKTAIVEAEAEPERWAQFGSQAREDYLRLYTPENNLEQLTRIYETVLSRSESAASSTDSYMALHS